MGMVKSSVGGADREDEDVPPDESQQAAQLKTILLVREIGGHRHPHEPKAKDGDDAGDGTARRLLLSHECSLSRIDPA